jgi:protein phosphatase PTC7
VEGCGQQGSGFLSVPMVGMRPSYPSSPAAIPRLRLLSPPRLCRDAYSWRNIRLERRYTSHSATPTPSLLRLPFRFDTGVALFAKRQPRPFPPPFLSPPSVSFSDPLSTHNLSRDRRAFVNGELIKGKTNGDDAVYASDYFIGANDGVGAWAARPRGHAG